jgi:peptide/nickel transport system permease protein
VSVDTRSARARFLREPGVRVSLIGLATLLLVAVFARWIAPFDPQQMLDLQGLRSAGASWTHPMGTDPYSRDLLSRMLVGARLSLGVAVSTVVLASSAGTLVGVCAGYVGGGMDRLLMRLTDLGLSMPRVLLLLTIVGVWGAPSVLVLVLLLASTGWMGVSRLVRGEVRALRHHERVAAARALGLRHRDIVWHHILPSVLPLLAVSATMGVGQVLLLESGLSFLGVGVPAPMASWGTILLDVSDVIGPARWLAIGPGVCLVATVVALHRVGDALEAALDVRRPR